ncbi:MAG: caspase family protein [Nannocystaceae bacterium]
MTHRALLLGSQTNGLRGVVEDVAAIDALLEARGFLPEHRHVRVGDDATREGILVGLRALIDETVDGDVVFLYYSGHGGRINNPRHLTDSSEPSTYTCIIPSDHTAENFRGIFSSELSALVAELTLRTRNVTFVLDCCHAEHATADGRLVAKAIEIPWRSEIEAFRDWLTAEGYDLGARADFVESNPHVVRLAACKSSQTAYEVVTESGKAYGLLTEALYHVLSESVEATPAWDAIAAAVHARVTAHYSAQEPVVLGPSERRLFDTVTTSRTDVLTYSERDGAHYLSGGALHGVTVGSRYLLMPLNANQPVREVALAEAEVVEVFTDRALVLLEQLPGGSTPRSGNRAYLVDPSLNRHGVALDGLSEPQAEAIAGRIGRSARLRLAAVGETDGLMSIRETEGALALHDRDGLISHVPWKFGADGSIDDETLSAVIVQAEALARASDLLDLPAPEGPTKLVPTPRLRWGRVGDVTSVFLPSAGASLAAGERIFISATSASPARVYVSILGIGVDRSIRLLSAGSPHGIELRPGESYTLGADDTGHVHGIPLSWAESVPTETPQPIRFIAICTDIPIDLRSLETDSTSLRRSIDEFLDPQGHIVHKGPGGPTPRAARYERLSLEIELRSKADVVDSPVGPPVPVDPSPTVDPKIDPKTAPERPPATPREYNASPTTIARKLPIPMLYISALPAGMAPLNFDVERRTLRDVLERLGARTYSFSDQPAASRGDVIRELQENQPGILHISCHGEEYRGLLLQDEYGNVDVTPAAWLVERATQTPNLGLVTLSACHSDTLALEIARTCNIDAIGFFGEIGEHYARGFYGLFYEMLSRGLNVEAACDRAAGVLPEPVRTQLFRAGPGVFPARQPPVPPDPDQRHGFPFIPSNLDFEGIDLEKVGDLDISEPVVEMSTRGKSIATVFRDTAFKLVDQADGSRIGVYFARSVRIAPNARLRVDGTNPGALVALTEMRIYGKIDATPAGNRTAPGGYKNDGTSDPQAGGPGGGDSNSDTRGGGGGSYGGIGGQGAIAPGGEPAAAGDPYGSLELVPLVGGSAGGGYAGGTGGGALQLVAGSVLAIGPNASINCGGGAGQCGGAAGNQHGYGGGSGGALLLEAPTITIDGTIAANGGSGGAGSMGGIWGNMFGDSGLASDRPAVGSNPGGGRPSGARGSAGPQLDGEDAVSLDNSKAGGGGGGAGRIRINTAAGAAKITGTVSPSLGTPCASQGRIRLLDT